MRSILNLMKQKVGFDSYFHRTSRMLIPLLHWQFLCCLLMLSGLATASTETLLLNNATTERVVVSHDPQLSPVSGITVEAWIRPSTVAGFQTIVGKGFSTGYWLGLGNGKIRFWNDGAVKEGTTVVPVSEWSHLAVTYDGVTMRAYVNGVLDSSWSVAGTIGINAAPLGIGGEGGSATFPDQLYPFTGRISEVRLWNYSRSEEQVRDTMYQQITSVQAGLIGVWPLEGGHEDRFGLFHSVLAPGASFSGLDSPALPHDPLRIKSATPIVIDGLCNEGGYNTATAVPSWYEDGDYLLAEGLPREIWLGADADYIYVCMPLRKSLNDPIYTVEIDVENHATNKLQNDDRRFRFWPGNDGLTTWVGSSTNFGSTWVAGTNPPNLLALDGVPIEFARDFEMRIPRNIFPDPEAGFRIRVSHNFLVNGVGSRDVGWPIGSSTNNPGTWQEVKIDLSGSAVADNQNPDIREIIILDDRPKFFEDALFHSLILDDVDLELIELIVDGVVVDGWELPGDNHWRVVYDHEQKFPVGRHFFKIRAYDHVGRESESDTKSFIVDVDGEPPRLALILSPPEPAPGEAITLTARAIDAAGVQTIGIRNILTGLTPSIKNCDFSGSGVTESCVWTFTPDNDVTMLSIVATAWDDEGYSNQVDRLILIGNEDTDTDDDGLSDIVEAGLCTSPSDPDTDGDGLSDGWEILGIQFEDGSVEPLPDYGSNPCWKNILIQLDYEVGAMPPASGIAELRNQYRENDINVYLEMNERPQPTVYDQSHLSPAAALYQIDDGNYYLSPQRVWAFFYGYKSHRSAASWSWNRLLSLSSYSGSVGYCSGGTDAGEKCLSDFTCGGGGACQAGCDDGSNKTMGCSSATDCPMDDGTFAICSAPCVTKPGATGSACRGNRIADMNYALIHELGHSAGLGHGGWNGSGVKSSDGGFVSLDIDWDDTNYKPNQVSIMNYLYSQGQLCMKPLPDPVSAGYIPKFTGQLAYLKVNMGNLNENELNESNISDFATRLRATDCSHAGPDFVPVFKYSCKILDTLFETLSDGNATLARRNKNGSWDFSIAAHAPGIDWNCSGVIEGATVVENVDFTGGKGGDGKWNESLWLLEDNLSARPEFSLLPVPVSCQNLYRARCSDRANSCYVWPSAYQNGIPTLASGKAPVDCRDEFLANRSTHVAAACRGGLDEEFGTSICPKIERDSLLVTSADTNQIFGFAGMAVAASDTDITSPEHEKDFAYPLPGVEICDLNDNDGDGEVDEGCNDLDSDNIPDIIDNCKTVANTDQADRDDDGLGDVCQFPALNNLVATWDGNRNVNLIWGNDGVPIRGVVVYRYGITHPNPQFRGGSYPTAVGSAYADAVGAGDTYTYVVRPLNLNGVEGEPVVTTVVVDISEEVFKDSFESP